MGLPTSAIANLETRVRSGIILGISPSTGGPYRVEIQRSTVNTTASSQWKSIFMDASSLDNRFTDYLPLSTRTFYYRMRHVSIGMKASSFSAVISAKPDVLPDNLPSLAVRRNNLGNVEFIGADIWLSSSKTAKVGTQATTGKVTKTLRWGADQFLQATTAIRYNRQAGALSVPTTNTTAIVQAHYVLPKGIVVTKYSVRGRRSTAGEKLVTTLYRISTAGAATAIATLTLGVTGIGQGTVSSSALSETIGDSNYLIARTTMKSAAFTNLPYIIYSELEYKMPTYITQY